MYFVYFAKSLKNNKVYVGYTNKDPNVRVFEHNYGSNKWTSQNGPFEIIYYENYHCIKDAKHRELFYKTGFGKQIKYAIIKVVSAKSRSASGRG